MRGKAALLPDTHYLHRITPAYAGKSATAQIFRNLYGDHPRVCGEKYQKPTDMLQGTGSPPRMRGKV